MSDPFRDDHEAALARIDALEEELAEERARDARQEQRVAALEAQLSSAREQLKLAKLAGLEAKVRAGNVTEARDATAEPTRNVVAPDARPEENRSIAGFIVLLVLAAALLLGLYATSI